jgi:hypothetical protein
MRVRKIHDLQDLGASESAELCCFHDAPFNSTQAGAPSVAISATDRSTDDPGGW